VAACLLLDSRFAASNPAEDDGFLRAIISEARIPSEGKQSCPRVVRFCVMLQNINFSYFRGKIHRQHSRQNSPALLLNGSAGNCQSALVDESGLITKQIDKHNNYIESGSDARSALCIQIIRIKNRIPKDRRSYT
jgi:hypothetical protein